MERAEIRKNTHEEGFTLALVAILLVVAAMVGATIFHKSKRDEFWNPKVNTQKNMEKIVDVLVSYQREFQQLPCPASRTVSITSAAHGVANCALGSPAVSTSGGVRIGAIPYKTLNLSVDISGDDWGNKYTYAVTQTLTVPGTGAGQFMVSNGTINVGGLTPAITDAAFVLVSHGPDAKGAYRNAGTNMLIACTAAGTDLENCDNDNTFFSGTLSKAAGATHYDDHLLWRPVDYTAQNM